MLLPIDGSQSQIDPATPQGALAQFYKAFNQRDLGLMAQNWAPGDAASMDNPLGGIKRGWDQIRPVYERIFSGLHRVEVEFFDYTIQQMGPSFLAVGRERGQLVSDGSRLELQIRTSRFFWLIDGRWRQIHHHGSIDDATQLARYQRAVGAS